MKRWVCVLVLAGLAAGVALPERSFGRMIYGETGRLDAYDPFTIHEASGHRLADLLFDSLIEIGPGNSYEGGLATSWDVAKDGTYVTLNLREGVTWAKSTRPFTSADVVKTVELLTNEASEIPNKDRFASLQSAKAMGHRRVLVHFKQAIADPLKLLNFKILPAFAFEKITALKRDMDFTHQPVGTGPYMFEKASSQGEVLLVANPNYFRGKPKIDTIVMKTYADQNIMTQSLMFHSLDLITFVSPRSLPEVTGDRNLTLAPYDALAFSFIALNTKRGVLADKRVRQALAFGINREEMLKAFFNNQGRLISGPFSPSSWAYDLDVKPMLYDAKRAAQLLTSAGLVRNNDKGPLRDSNKKLVQLTFAVPISGESELIKRIALAYQGYMEKLGIDLRFKFMDWTVWKKKVLGEHDYDLTIASWNFDDANNIKSLFHSSHAKAWGNNFVGFSSPEVDTLLTEADVTNDFDKKRAIYHKLHQVLADEAPYTYLWTLKHHAAHAMSLNGVQVDSFSFFKNIGQWSTAPKGQEML